ncbi:unnamed protein product [Peniophora sp. CBMAI 1063]|nr:unnamed protein product [Peniophora sp. CBMAI 1063]
MTTPIPSLQREALLDRYADTWPEALSSRRKFKLLLNNAAAWVAAKYGIDDPWRLLYADMPTPDAKLVARLDDLLWDGPSDGRERDLHDSLMAIREASPLAHIGSDFFIF